MKKAANIKLVGDIAADIGKANPKKKNPASTSSPDNTHGAVMEGLPAAALAKSKDSPAEGKRSPDPDSLGAMAAAAAAKRGHEKEEVLDMGGIAATDAMTASQRKVKTIESADGDASETKIIEEETTAKPEPPTMGGIAAMAAAAAAKRNRNKQESPDIGGIAAMAAMTASQRQSRKGGNLSERNPAIGDIAVMAAAVAAERTRDKQERPDLAGIAAMAAMAASQRQMKKAELSNGDVSERNPTIGGIAAMAAAAAAKRNRNKQERPDLGGIAAMAAMAASQRPMKMAESTDGGVSKTKVSEEETMVKLEPPTMGNIAAMAAAAAAKRTQDKHEPSNTGSIAAMTAMTSSQRQLEETKFSNGESAETRFGEEETMAKPGSPTIGGIAAAATAAVTAKKRSSSDDVCGDDNSSAGESASSKKLKSSTGFGIGSDDDDSMPMELVRQEGSFADIGLMAANSTPAEPPTVDKAESSPLSPLGTEIAPMNSKKHLSPLRSEAYGRSDRSVSDTSFQSLDYEVACHDDLPAQLIEQINDPIDGDQKSITDLTEELSNSPEDGQRSDSGNPFQRWIPFLGGSKELSEDHASTELTDEAPPVSPPKSPTKETDNGFTKFFRQLSGRDHNASSLPTESPVPSTLSAPSPTRSRRASNESLPSNPLFSFMQSLSMSPLDSTMIAKQAIENDAFAGLLAPTLSHDESQASKDSQTKSKVLDIDIPEEKTPTKTSNDAGA